VTNTALRCGTRPPPPGHVRHERERAVERAQREPAARQAHDAEVQLEHARPAHHHALRGKELAVADQA
jgi:hypothetical protein